MTLNGVMGSGAMAVQAGMDRLDSIAHEIATHPVQALEAVGGQQSGTNNPVANKSAPRDLVESLTELNEVIYTVEAGVVAVRTGQHTFGALLAVV